jgi:PhnB protein
MGRTEEAFNFYKVVFRTEFIGQLHRMSDTPTCSGTPQIGETER